MSSIVIALLTAAAVSMRLVTADASQSAFQARTPLGEQTSADEPNPFYVGWTCFEPGAWVVRKYQSPAGYEARETLKSLRSTEAAIEVRRKTDALGALPPQIESIPARRPALRRTEVEVKESDESMTLNGRRVRCRVERGPFLGFWYCPEIPGGVARVETKAAEDDWSAWWWVTEWGAGK